MNLQRDDAGIIGSLPNGGYQVFGAGSRNGRHAQVLPDAHPSGYKCDDAACRSAWCIHIDTVRVHIGLTKLHVPNDGLAAVEPRPQEATAAVEQEPKKTHVQSAILPDSVGEAEPRPQVRGSRKLPDYVALQSVPVPLERTVKGVTFRLRGSVLEIDEMPASMLLTTMREVYAMENELGAVVAGFTLDADVLVQAILSLPRREDQLWGMDKLLEVAVPNWTELVADDQDRLRKRFPHVCRSVTFQEQLKQEGLRWHQQKDPENKRQGLYGVRKC
ncbi:MAG: hypothetical protein WC876_06280 [Candidatus Thermoplasmatota archaeon]